MDRSCEKYISMLSPYIDGQLTPSEKNELEQHLSRCHQCRDILESYEALSPEDMLADFPVGLHGDIMARVNKEKKKKKRVFPFRYGTLAAAMVALVILGASGVFDGIMGRTSTSADMAEASVENAAAVMDSELKDKAAQTIVVSSSLEAGTTTGEAAPAEPAPAEEPAAEEAITAEAEPEADEPMLFTVDGGEEIAESIYEDENGDFRVEATVGAGGVTVSGVELPEADSVTFTAVVTGITDDETGCIVNVDPEEDVEIDSSDDIVVDNSVADSEFLEVGSEITITVRITNQGDELIFEATEIN